MVPKGNVRGLQARGRFGKLPFFFYVLGQFAAATREHCEMSTKEKDFS